MKNRNIDLTRMQDHHLDVMIRIAFDLEDAEDAAELIDSQDPELSQDELMLSERILSKAFDICNKRERMRRRGNALTVVRRISSRVLQIVACIVLVFTITGAVAIAGSSVFRSKVMELLISVDKDRGEIRYEFVEDTVSSFLVPELWGGEYFPSLIPEGYSLWDINEYFAIVEFRDNGTGQIIFCESGNEDSASVGTDDSNVSSIEINGACAGIIEGYSREDSVYAITITWAIDDRWFSLLTRNVEKTEAIKIAESVKKILR